MHAIVQRLIKQYGDIEISIVKRVPQHTQLIYVRAEKKEKGRPNNVS